MKLEDGALQALMNGKRIRRKPWERFTDEGFISNKSYLNRVLHVQDLFAGDWEVEQDKKGQLKEMIIQALKVNCINCDMQPHRIATKEAEELFDFIDNELEIK